MKKSDAINLIEEAIFEFWITCDANSFIKKFCANSFVSNNNSNILTLSDLQHRMEHNKQHYSYRHLNISELFLIDNKAVAKYNLSALDNNTEKPIAIELVEIFKSTGTKIIETWILGDLSYAAKYRYISGLTTENIEPSTNRLQIAHLKSAINKFARQVRLSDRQTECLTYILAGYTAKEMAQILNLSHRTIESYIEIIKHKHDCPSKRDLIRKILPDSPLVAPRIEDLIDEST